MRTGQAGTLESNDIMITISPGPAGSGLKVELDSIVLTQYGDAIQRIISETVTEQGMKDLYVKAVDRGALDCTIRARVLAALARSGVVLKEDIV